MKFARRTRSFLTASLTDLDEDRLGPEQGARVRAERLMAVRSMTVPMMVANLVNGGLLAYPFVGQGRDGALAAWYVVLCALVVPALASGLRGRGRRSRGSRQSVRRVVRHSALLAAVWGAAPIILLPVAHGNDLLVLSSMIAGMMTGGAFALASAFGAVIAWSGIIGAGAVVALLLAGQPVHLTAAVYTLMFIAILAGRARKDAVRELESHARREALADKGEMVELLLREHEALSAEATWGTDREGRVVRWPESFGPAGTLNPPGTACSSGTVGPKAQEGPRTTPMLVDALRNAATREGQSELERLERFVRSGEAFHDVTVELKVPNRNTDDAAATRWIALRGAPRHRDGAFVGFQGIATDVTAERAAEQRVRFLASHDVVTGLANRGAHAARVKALIADQRPFALVSVDLDRFKAVNDTHGHAAGDALLRALASRLGAIAHEVGGTAARIGGDEFALVLPTRTVGDAGVLAARVAQVAIGALARDVIIDNIKLRAGGSAGIAIHPTDGDAPERLDARADLALYRAKAEGRGRWMRYAPEMDERAAERRQMEIDLGTALSRDELSLVFQPIVTERDGAPVLTAMETLLRWAHPRRGSVSPAEFIPVAETSGVIVPIGDWVLREACRTAATWREPIKVSVNASPRQMRSGGFLPSVMGALAASGLPAGRLEIELTESVLADEGDGGEAIASLIDGLRELGVSVALDDFGTGYSSLSYLRRFRFDRLKIDRSFVNELETAVDDGSTAGCDGPNDGKSAEGRAIVRAIVDMARALGLAITAEGVERVEQATALREMGCTTYQGWLYGRPLPHEQATERAGGALVPIDPAGSDGPVVPAPNDRPSDQPRQPVQEAGTDACKDVA